MEILQQSEKSDFEISNFWSDHLIANPFDSKLQPSIVTLKKAQ